MSGLPIERPRAALRNLMKTLLVIAVALPMVQFGPMAWGSGIAHADPPPWAPAHGYRDKHQRGRGHGNVVVVEPAPVYVVPFGIGDGTCRRDLVGAAIGGAAGGLIGSEIGRGSGRSAAIVSGAVIGAIIGGAIGQSMDNVDQNCVGQVLEHAEDDRPVAWRNDGRERYTVTPIRTYETRDGRYCREYVAGGTIDGRDQRLIGTACRGTDGVWQIAN